MKKHRLLIAVASVMMFFMTSEVVKAQEIASHQTQTRQADKHALANVLKELENRYQVVFFYDAQLIQDLKMDKFKSIDGSLEKSLKKILTPFKLTFTKLNHNNYAISSTIVTKKPEKAKIGLLTPEKEIFMLSSIATTERKIDVLGLEVLAEIGISGTVTDENGSPIPGANVLLKDTNTGTITDQNGKYVLKIADTYRDNGVLIFSFVGYLSQEIAISGQSQININLLPDTRTLAEVVVVGYGEQRKATLTGSVSSLKNEDLLKRQVASASNLLQGLATGVVVTQQSGKPGADGGTIRIRGVGSITSSAAPLVLVDNVEMSLDAIDPNMIESISVLKDAASTSIFGSRAANGVILVKTKRGTGGKTTVSYNNFLSVQQATNLPQKLSAIDHMELYNEALVNSGRARAFPDALINGYKQNPIDNFRYIDTDWIGGVMSNNGFMQNHNLLVNASTERVNTVISGTYLTQNGLTANTDFKKFDLRFNTDIKLTSKLKLLGDLWYNQSTTTAPGGATPEFIIRQALGVPAIGAGKFGDDQYGDAAQSNKRNPIAQAEASGQRTSAAPTTMLKAGLQYTPIAGLTIEGFYARNFTTDRDRTYLKNYNVFRPDLVSNTIIFDNLYPGVNSISESVVTSVKNTYWAQATYEFKLQESHNFKVMSGFQGEDIESRGIGASRTNLPSDQPYLNVGTQNQQNSGGISQLALAGFFARANYNYKDKYLFEINGRYDGSSRFSQLAGKQWGFFPSASAGWVISEEAFLKQNKIVTFAKVRASYGTLGNQNIPGGFYPFASNLSPNTNYYFNNALNSGYSLLTGGNQGVTWEKSTQANLGIDLELFSGKISITADIYQRKIDDMLINVPIPSYVGYNPPLRNAGSMVNNGWELSVKHRNKIGDFRYDITFLLSDVRNEVKDLRNQEFVNGLFLSRVGYALNSYYGYLTEGLFQTTDEIKAAPTHFANTAPGDIRYSDVSGAQGVPDGKIDQFDRVVLGNNFPRYDFGINGNASWKGFDFNFLLQGVGKRDNYMSGTGAWAFFASDFIATGYEFHKDRWTPTNTGAGYPRLTDGITNNQINSAYWMRNGAYMRLKNLQIGYTLPTTWLAKVKIQQLRFYVAGSNLFTVSNFYKGFDPERNDNNGEFYPVMKTYTFGMNLRF